MRQIFLLLGFFGVLFNVGLAETFEERKARLEQELLNLEQEEQEIKDLEEKIRAKRQQNNTQTNTSQTPQRESVNNHQNADSQKRATQNTQSTRTPYAQKFNTQTDDKNRNGVLLGLAVGSMPTESNIHLLKSVNLYGVKSNFVPFGLRLGYQYFGGNDDLLGFRAYFDYFYMSGKDKESTSNELLSKQTLWNANLDLLLELRIPSTYAYFGVFGGLGYGGLNYEAADSVKLEVKQMFYNVGLALTLGARHRLEFAVKIPKQKAFSIGDIAGQNYKTSNLSAFTYQYTF